MRTTKSHGAIGMAAAFLVAVTLCAVWLPASAFAVPVGSQIAATQAQQARSQQIVAQMHADLMAQMSAYTTLCTALHQSQREVSQNTSDLARLDSTLATYQAQLDDRAALLYQSSGDHVIELFLSRSIQDFMMRAEYLVTLGESDSALVQ